MLISNNETVRNLLQLNVIVELKFEGILWVLDWVLMLQLIDKKSGFNGVSYVNQINEK